jgi:ubiquinone/menaquinone biosynthesis C-methylase UbiE
VSADDAARAWAESLAPVTSAMLEIARPIPGERVLDVGAGAGQLSLEIALLVGPAGEVVAIDPAPGAVEVIGHRAADVRDCAPVRALVAGAESLELGEGRFDLAVARNSVMYFEDLPRGLANLRRALRPDGRFVASIYAALDEEPFHAIPLAAVRRRTSLSHPLPEYAAAFALSADDFESALRASGWHSVSHRDVPVRRTFDSLESLGAALRGSRSLAELLGRLPETHLAEVWQDIDAGFGPFADLSGVVVPGRQIVVSAMA